MEIEIKNFGPIDSVKFDLDKDLHLIYGENAIGKSYATYCLYCLIKNIKNKNAYNNFLYNDNSLKNSVNKLIKETFKNIIANKPIDCTSDILILIENELKDIVLNELQNSLQNTFSSLSNLRNRYSNLNYEIIITISNVGNLRIYSDCNGMLGVKYVNEEFKFEFFQKASKSSKFSLYSNNHKVFGTPTEEYFINYLYAFLTNIIQDIFTRIDTNIRDIYYLPAGRSGLYQALNAFTPIVAQLTQSRFFLKNKSIELPSLSEPLADYFIDLSTIETRHLNNEFVEIIKLLEDEIIKGEVEYNKETNKIVFKPKGTDLELNLSEASSMVAELSPLVLYFKHILNHKYHPSYGWSFPGQKDKNDYDILFIEEPEAHLHPKIQVKLIEIFAKLSSLNIKIFITSHSNYMFNKLNNLLIKKELDPKIVEVYHFVHTDNGTVVNSNMKVTEDGIDDENFQDVSEQLYFERLNYYENNVDTKDQKA